MRFDAARAGLVAAILAALVPVDAWAFRGRVVNAQGQGVARAEVYVLGRPGEAITDADGRFEWKPDPPPPFEVLVVLPDGSYAKPVLVEAYDAAAEITITVESLLNEMVTVSGSAPGIESTPAAGTTTLSGAELGARQPANLMQALENVAGVSQVSEGQAAVPAVRGLARGRTLILVDGARVSSERRAGPSATFLDPIVVDSIDVARGPGSVAYGSDAFGGVISVRTARIVRNSPLEARVTASAGAGVPERRAAAQVTKGFAEGGFLVAAHLRDAGDWTSPGGVVATSGYRDRGFLLRGERQAGRGSIGASWQSDFGRDIGRPRDNSHVVRFSYPEDDSHRFTAQYELPQAAGLQRIGVSVFAGSSAQVTSQDRFATASAPRGVERAEVTARDWGARAFGEKLAGRARVEFGIDLNGRVGLHALDVRETYDVTGSLAARSTSISIDSATRTDAGVYASVDQALGARLSLAGGVRADRVTTRNEGGFFGTRTTAQGAGSGYLALTAGTFRGWSATVQVARGFRDPTLSDRYYRGPTGRGFVTGNPDLGPETSLQADLAVRYTAPRVRVAAFYYHYRLHDLVERHEAARDTFLFRNRGRARLRGFEVEAQVDLGRGLTIELAHQATDGRATDDDASLDDVAPIAASVQARKQFAGGAFAQARLALTAADDDPGPTERAVPGFTQLDVSAGLPLGRALELRLLGRNLLNETYFASPDTRAVLAPGRAGTIVISLRF